MAGNAGQSHHGWIDLKRQKFGATEGWWEYHRPNVGAPTKFQRKWKHKGTTNSYQEETVHIFKGHNDEIIFGLTDWRQKKLKKKQYTKVIQ